MSDQKPITYQFIIERWADGLKVLGAGHGAGILASAASIQYFSGRPEFFFYIKLGANFFVVGVIFFALAFAILTILPLVIDGHHAKTNKTYKGFVEMMKDIAAGSKNDAFGWYAFVLLSLSSFILFLLGCMQALAIVLRF